MKHGEALAPKSAFLFNVNARSVTPAIKHKLERLIPKTDIFFSRNLKEAEEALRCILSQGYAYIFCGGGDGTVINTINLLRRIVGEKKTFKLPKVGVLKLGTGNALARLLEAKRPETDIENILAGKAFAQKGVPMVESEEGLLSPFAGIGYDGEIINDFESIRKKALQGPFRHVFSSFLGFTIAGLFKTLPRQFNRESSSARLTSSFDAFRIVQRNGIDCEEHIPAGNILYDGYAPMICVGTIDYLGYGFRMFPFAGKKPGYMHVRICASPLGFTLSRLYPSVWKGHFRHPQLYDFLVKDVTIVSDTNLAYQFGGDAMGSKKRLYFKVSHEPVAMVQMTNHSELA